MILRSGRNGRSARAVPGTATPFRCAQDRRSCERRRPAPNAGARTRPCTTTYTFESTENQIRVVRPPRSRGVHPGQSSKTDRRSEAGTNASAREPLACTDASSVHGGRTESAEAPLERLPKPANGADSSLGELLLGRPGRTYESTVRALDREVGERVRRRIPSDRASTR